MSRLCMAMVASANARKFFVYSKLSHHEPDRLKETVPLSLDLLNFECPTNPSLPLLRASRGEGLDILADLHPVLILRQESEIKR